jgi:urate oxidase
MFDGGSMDIHESLIIGVSFTESENSKVMIVGRQKNGVMDIVNAFQGEEAQELYTKLTTQNVNKGE